MKILVNLACILIALWITGCVVEERHERERHVVVAEPPLGVVVEVPYDDPDRGWYIEGYYGPGNVWIAPFWTFDIDVVHRHFDHYRGRHRGEFEEHFRGHPEKYEGHGREHHAR